MGIQTSRMRSVSKKVILTGSFAVGKTSLVSQFVYRKFPESYKTTLGVRIDKKVVELENVKINMIIWDIGGEQSQIRIPDSYYLGSSGVIYVFDLSRPASFLNMAENIEYIRQKLPRVPIIIVGNKVDLLDDRTLQQIKAILPIPADYFTSALHGENVENMFLELAQQIV